MRVRVGFLLTLSIFLFAGCATPPQSAVVLQSSALGAASGRVGVAMTELPQVDTYLPGASCLLCMAAASAANSTLTSYAKTLPHEDLPQLKSELAGLLRKKGVDAIVIEEGLKLEALAANDGKGPNVARRDFTPLQKKYGIDKLLVLQIEKLGFVRNYSAYVPTSDPKGTLQGVGYMVNLKNNAYEWYQHVNVVKSAEGKWDEPPKFPGLTNAYYQAVEVGKDRFLETFKQ